MRLQNVEISEEQIADICRRHHIRKLSLFGSVLREDFRSDSDVDVLVLFEPGIPVGFRIFEIEQELARLFGGHRVDIINEKYLNPRLKQRILRDARVQYAEG
jgi:predicted nucleotidyltransferase